MFGQLLQKLPRHQSIPCCRVFLLTFLTSTLDLPLQLYNNQTLPTHPTKTNQKQPTKTLSCQPLFNFEGRDRGGRRDLRTFGPAACATEGPGAGHHKNTGKRGLVSWFWEERSLIWISKCVDFLPNLGSVYKPASWFGEKKPVWVMLSLFSLCIYVYTYFLIWVPINTLVEIVQYLASSILRWNRLLPQLIRLQGILS